ncbi:cysteine hydrolase [Frisingicoccus caecimuris]|uniref:Nicotinamidase-related amidase n=1 Tax=Frisingicoccus caecimuris TaxID=1796636 RepID=A0A4R2LL00_9FIRM|nr:isochorismatase family cysteine hydrolase [Frisingicoccus caecimuris]MCR1919450.1 cysteine hydrolase [Frisingicoccus caecimuris]TCO84026.1 nicotinamidase-related amidase [Frisingicoccus caecimuris]HAP19931.1 amidase [Lachnospiraceae bacterium]
MSKYLVVVDMQKDFIDGSLGSAEAQAVLPKVIEKIKNFPGTVVYTRDTHEDNYLETLEGKKLPVVHCVRDTEGWKFQDDIQQLVTANRSLVFDKETFGSIQMAGCLQGIDRMAPIDEVIVVGLCTDICVMANATLIRTAMPNTPVRVDASCCAGSTPEAHRCALEAMKSLQIEIDE